MFVRVWILSWPFDSDDDLVHGVNEVGGDDLVVEAFEELPEEVKVEDVPVQHLGALRRGERAPPQVLRSRPRRKAPVHVHVDGAHRLLEIRQERPRVRPLACERRDRRERAHTREYLETYLTRREETRGRVSGRGARKCSWLATGRRSSPSTAAPGRARLSKMKH